MGKSKWIEHDGKGRPVPIGTLIDIRLFNGDVLERVRPGQICVDLDGTVIKGPGRWNGWRYDDGGPMAPKFKAYRLCKDEAKARSVAKFSHLLLPARKGKEVAHG